jgi:hypothetical protein
MGYATGCIGGYDMAKGKKAVAHEDFTAQATPSEGGASGVETDHGP